MLSQLSFSFSLILILIYFNAKRSAARTLPIARSRARPANPVEDGAGSDKAPLVGNHLGSGESLFLTWKTCAPFLSVRKWGLASSRIQPPRPSLDLHSQGSHYLFLPTLPPAFDVKPSPFAISTPTRFQNIPSLPCSWFLFKMVVIILF